MTNTTPFRDLRSRPRSIPGSATLVDFLVVISLIAILAAAAVERLSPANSGVGDRGSALAAVRGDLLRALRAEESHRRAGGSFQAFVVGPGEHAEGLPFRASGTVSVTARVGEDGVMIVGRHRFSPGTWCLSSGHRRVVEAATC